MSEKLVTTKDTKVTKERPILMSGEMVRAILEGRKTQTRRPIPKYEVDGAYKLTEIANGYGVFTDKILDVATGSENSHLRRVKCPYGQPGDRLWVRETAARVFVPDGTTANKSVLVYRADNPKGLLVPKKWAPSIHMPRWASRILLEIVDVRVERVQEMKPVESISEGVYIPQLNYGPAEGPYAIATYANYWDKLYSKSGCSWESNPWVWVIEFKVIEPTLTPHLSQKELGCAEIATLSHRCAIGE